MSDVPSPVPIEELLAHAGWVRSLAAALLRDPSQVDDVVQDTWVAALKSPPRDRDRIRGWLRRVVRNLVHEKWRSETSRSRREAASARPEATSGSGDVFARADAHRHLVDEVLALPPAYGEVLLLRHFEGLPPRAIAERLGVPVETVKSRLKRGLSVLRERYQHRAEREGGDWRLLLLPVIGDAGPTSVPVPAGRQGSLRPVAVAGIVAAIGLGAFLALRPRGADTTGPLAAAPAAAVRDTSPSRSARARPPAVPTETTAAVVPPTASADHPTVRGPHGPPPFRGRIAGDPDLLAGEIPLEVRPLFAEARWTPAPPVLVVAKDGEFDLDLRALLPDATEGRRVSALEFTVARRDLLPTRTSAPLRERPETKDRETVFLRISPAVVGRGLVLGDDGAPVGGAWVAAFVVARGSARKVDGTTSSADGSFSLRLEPGVEQWIAAAVETRCPRVVRVTPDSAGFDVPPLTLEAGHTVSGSVVDADGGAIAGVPVDVRAARFDTMLMHEKMQVTSDGTESAHTVQSTSTDAGGSFRIEGVAPGRRIVTASRNNCTGALLTSQRRDVDAPCGPLEFRIGGAAVEVLLSGPSGPIAVRGFLQGSAPPATGFQTDDSGRALLVGVPGETCTMSCSPPGLDPVKQEIVFPGAGETVAVRVEAKLSPKGTFEGVLEGPGAGGVRTVGVAVHEVKGGRAAPAALKNFDVPVVGGRFVVPDLAPGERSFAVRPGAGWYDPASTFAEVRRIGAVPAGGTVSVVFPLQPAGRLVIGARTADGTFVGAFLRIAGPDGADVSAAVAIQDSGHTLHIPGMTSVRGVAHVFPALPAGTYRVTFKFGTTEVVREAVVRAGAVTEVVAEFE